VLVFWRACKPGRTQLIRTYRTLLLAFGIAQAVLYSSLLPLWEGFDEPWHYGYVQYLSTARQFPVLGKTRLSQEVWSSMLVSPVSHVVHSAWTELQPFDAYFQLGPDARARERSVLDTLPRNPAAESSHANYEIQQAPLAYAVLAVPDFLLRDVSLPRRILWLRIFNSVVSVVLTFVAAEYLFQMLGLSAPFRALGLFCIFACQMYWATTAHIACDGLALALSIWYFGALAAFSQRPELPGALRLSLAMSLGLLAKAYFLPLAVFAVCLVAWRRIHLLPVFAAIPALLAGPWYARNLALYHNLSGLLMSSAGISPREALASLFRVHWAQAIPYMLRATLWTGNNSFTNFSTATLNCLLALLAAGVLMYAVQALRTRKLDAGEFAVIGAAAVLGAAIIYVVGNDVILLHGTSAGASPWYTEPLLPPLLAIALLGMSRMPRFGRPVAAGVCLVWMYISIATYLVKLIPLYGGYTAGRSTLREILQWYVSSGAKFTNILSTISLAPPDIIFIETALVTGVAITLGVRLTAWLFDSPVAP
jgi:hypothetical protein